MELKQFVWSGIKDTLIKSIKTWGKCIATIENISNYELISKPVNTGVLSIFNREKTDAQEFIDSWIVRGFVSKNFCNKKSFL